MRAIVWGVVGCVACGPPTTFGIGTDGIEPLVGERQIQIQGGAGGRVTGKYEKVGDAGAATLTWTEPLSNRVSIATSIGGGLGNFVDRFRGNGEMVYFSHVGVEGRFRLVRDLDAPVQVTLLSGLQLQTAAPSENPTFGWFGGSNEGIAPYAGGVALGAVVSGRVGPVRPYLGVKGNGTWGSWPGLHAVGAMGATWQPRDAPRLKFGAEASVLVGSHGTFTGGSIYGRWTFGTAKDPTGRVPPATPPASAVR